VLGVASTSAPVVLILDDLHWAAKPTLLLLRHLLRFGEHARVQIVGTYRSTDLDRSHPLAAMLADLHRDGSATRLQLSGLDEVDVSAYVAEAGYDDEELGRALASVTGGNPFFLIEALRHVDESGGRWDPSTLPQGVREAVSRRLSRLPAETNKALAAAAVVGSRFALELVERVLEQDLVDAFDEASKAGIVIEEPGGRYRFNHAIVRQSLLAELASVRRMRLHQSIAATLETEPGADDELLADLAHHYFECAWAGNAAKAVDYCRRAADQAMARLAYEGAADLYDHAVHALEEIDEELPDRDDQQAELLVARCEALLAAGDVVSAAGAVSQLQAATHDSPRLAAWGTCFDGQLSMLTHPERLDEIETALAAAAEKLAELDDAAGEAKAHTVRAGCLARLGRIADAETALDHALTAARRAREHRRVNAVLANAPLAALWGPNPVPRAGGRCLDVVRLLRITTGSPVVEATSTRCQAVLDALRGRAAAGRSLLDSARRTLTELGMRHALLEVDQFAGILELVADDPAAAEPHLRRAYNGFRRMGLDADTAETAALLARACLALDRDAEADELCTESERLAGHALKASIAWRTVRAQLLARGGAHDEARRVAEEAVAVAEHTDLLVDHGDACLALATVLGFAGDSAGARAAAQQAVGLYELKGAAALAEKASRLLGAGRPAAPAGSEAASVELDNTCMRAVGRLDAAVGRGSWSEVDQLVAPVVSVENRRKIVGFPRVDLPSNEYVSEARRYHQTGPVRHRHAVVAVRGERVAVTRLELGTTDMSPGAPRDEALQLFGIDEHGRITMEVWFDIEDLDAAVAELDAAHAREEHPRTPLENAASLMDEGFYMHFAARDWDAMAEILADDYHGDDRRRVVGAGVRHGRDAEIVNMRAIADVGITNITSTVIATRGDRLVLTRDRYSGRDQGPEAFHAEVLGIVEISADNRIVAGVWFDLDDIGAAFEELEARYLAGEAAPYARGWQFVMDGLGALNRHEAGPMTREVAYVDHRRVPFAPGDFGRAVEDLWALVPDARYRLTAVHGLDAHGVVGSLVIEGTDVHGNELEWARICLISFGSGQTRMDVYEEDDLDAALARFEELRPAVRRLENAATQMNERFLTCFVARDWDAMATLMVDDSSIDDRRRAVNAGLRRGRDAEIASMRAIADLGFQEATSVVIATRGERLALSRDRFLEPEGFLTEVLGVLEINADERIGAVVVFDVDDIAAAFEELDARYVAGEAAAHSHMWSVVTRAYATLNRHELPPTTPDFVSIDHRRGGSAFAPGDLLAYVRASWDDSPDNKIYVEAVHRLSNVGAVVTSATQGASLAGFNAEWREIGVVTVDGDMLNRTELFDEAHLDAALATFDELSRPARRLENAASQLAERFWSRYEARDWDALRETLADDVGINDRRPLVNFGLRQGPDSVIEIMRAAPDMGVPHMTQTVIATRGERLVLIHTRFSARDQRSDAFYTDVLHIFEINADNQIAAFFLFDPDDIHAAIEELDARYLAGEAAAHSHMWTLIARVFAAINRRELPELAPDWANIDHRRGIAFEPGDMTAYIRAIWDDTPDVNVYIEAVHGLSDLGAVVTQAATGTSQQGFAAEWRAINISTVDDDLINRCELFDEADLDAAISRFEELSRPTPRLENAATQVTERFWTNFAARDWAALAEATADDISTEDRRRVVNVGTRHGRDADMANLRAMAELNGNATSTAIAIRGERLVLSRLLMLAEHDEGAEAFRAEGLGLTEINADNRIAARVVFDLDDIDAAIAELDARYLAGEAAPYSQTWSVVAGGYAASNRRELPATTPDWVNIDHRRAIAFAPGELAAYTHATWDIAPDVKVYIQAVHRLSNLGAVVTQAVRGTSHEGFEAEWREITLVTVDGDLINRIELFDEADIDAALARFDELSRPDPRLENAASQVFDSFRAFFAARDWTAMAEILAEDMCNDDRRPVVGAEVLHGRDTDIAHMRAIADVGAKAIASTVIATRGERLVLSRIRFFGEDQRPDAFHTEILGIVEIDADERILVRLSFDADDLDAAFEELDARYLAGESAAHAHTWSVIAATYAAFNRHGLVPDWVSVDHRRGSPFASSDLNATISASRDLTPDLTIQIETVHRLGAFGAVVTNMSVGTSDEGFAAEWRMVQLLTIDGDRITRLEIFDEDDIDAALAGFDELSRPAPRLENAASQVDDRFRAHFVARDWDAMGEMLADHMCNDDRRRVVNAGVRRGRDIEIANTRAFAELGVTNVTSDVIAIRGGRLALGRNRFMGRDQRPEAFRSELLCIVEIDADARIVARVSFDIDEMDAALEELDARYLAGEAALHAHMWSVIARTYAAVNRRELPATTPDWVNIDHRRGRAFVPGQLIASIRSGWDLTPDISVYIEAVHRLSNLGGIVTRVMNGTSQAGFDAEWREIAIVTLEDDRISQVELFDEADIDTALARFAELGRPAPELENAASQVYERCNAYFAARDWDALAEIMADDIAADDRRRVVGLGVQPGGRETVIANTRAIADLGMANVASTVIATRGEHLILTRARYTGHDQGPGAFRTDLLDVVKIDPENRLVASVIFDPDDIDAGLEELDARYLAGEAAAHARTWSVVTRVYTALNRHEISAATPDWVTVDHRPVQRIGADDVRAYLRATWDVTPDIKFRIEEVHRLSSLGVVVTRVATGTSQEGFDAEWRQIDILTVDGDVLSRVEVFDEADIDAALARFDELTPSAPRLENVATQTWTLLADTFNRRDVDNFLALSTADGRFEDRRKGLRVVLEGPGRRKAVHAVFEEAPSSWRMEVEPVALRGSRLSLTRECYRDTDDADRPIAVELLNVTEVSAGNLVQDIVAFDPDDIEAAFEELDARFLAGEAAVHVHTWSVIASGYAALNRHEVPPTTPDWVNIDHRRGIAFAPGDMISYIRATWDVAPDVNIHIEAVHRLSNRGAVVTHAMSGSTQAGFDAEWREIALLMVEGDAVNHCEMFDEADIDAALARFDELSRPAPQLENAAIRARARVADAYNRRDVEGFLALTGGRYEDRRKGLRDEGAADRNFAHAVLSETPTSWRLEIEPVAIRGDRLALSRETFRDADEVDQPITVELIVLTEVADAELVSYTVFFDPADINEAIGELTARWIASGEVAHPEVIESVQQVNEIVSRHDWDAIAKHFAGAAYVNHRQLAQAGTGTITDWLSSMRTIESLVPDFWVELAEVLTRSAIGIVGRMALKGTSTEGSAIEIPYVLLILFDGGRVTSFEAFDEDQRDIALARFDELNRPA
jgi:tetratricopeptide (TPR) repeat protein